MQADPAPRRLAAVILAAGASRRLGQPKQLVVLAGETLLERTVRLSVEAGCNPVIVVLGCGAETILTHCRLGPARIVKNSAWEEGLASSIQTGVAAVQAETDAVLILTCDQPAVTAAHLQALAARVPDEVTASAYGGRQGVPAYFPAAYFGNLLQLTGDSGARNLLRAAVALDLSGGELDIDTPQNLAEAQNRYGR